MMLVDILIGFLLVVAPFLGPIVGLIAGWYLWSLFMWAARGR